MTLRRTLGAVAATSAALAAIAVSTAAPAVAAPTQASIDGKRPADMGCRADQRVIYSVKIRGAGQDQGFVELRASNYCHAVWVHVHGVRVVHNQTYVPHGLVHRNSDGRQYGCTGGENTQDCYTPMVWDRGVTSYGVGGIDPNGATGAYYQARTKSY